MSFGENIPSPTVDFAVSEITEFVMKRDMPDLNSDLPALADGSTYTTPSIVVPISGNNPFIIRENNPTGTVFIAVGAIVGAILLGFTLYHLIVSVTASRMAKKTLAMDKKIYEKYHHNNSTAYGFTGGVTPTSTTFNFGHENHGSISKLPLMNPSKVFSGNFNGSQQGDNSTIYASETNGAATDKRDLTKMFISPTAEVMQHKRVRTSQYNPIFSNASLAGSTANLNNPGNRHSQLVPSLYMNMEANNSEDGLKEGSEHPAYSINSSQQNTPGRNNRRALPSMYLEDLIDQK